jgi:SpoVK/Ycf46/Vps4 family AAA+-type ATPase
VHRLSGAGERNLSPPLLAVGTDLNGGCCGVLVRTEKEARLSRSQKVNADITALLRARTAALWISSREEKRVESACMNALPKGMRIRFWDAVSGLSEYIVDKGESKLVPLLFTPALNSYGDKKAATLTTTNGQPLQDPLVVLQAIREVPDKCLYILRDINAFKDPITLRSIRNTITEVEKSPATEQRAFVILTPSAEIPPDLQGQMPFIDYPIPDREDIEKIFDLLPLDPTKVEVPDAATREAAIDAALGLSAAEMQNCFYRSLVTLKKIDPLTISKEKKQVIAREKVLTWIDPNPAGLNAVGGLEVLKDWLKVRKSGFSLEARERGIKAPKGILVSGIPGTGKSLTAKCVSASWGMPLLKLDMGALKSKYVGDSEANIRKALQIAEAIAPCVLWLDEIEKALGGGGEDGGVSKDQLGTILTWMQDKVGSVFVIATANDVRSLPPELLRKGRFDQVFWVDLPTPTEREQILKVALKEAGRENGINVSELTERTDGWVGAEIASIVPEAMFAAFHDGDREITTEDLLTAAETVVPLSVTMAKKLTEIRDFMADKAVNASRPEKAKSKAKGKEVLDLDD